MLANYMFVQNFTELSVQCFMHCTQTFMPYVAVGTNPIIRSRDLGL